MQSYRILRLIALVGFLTTVHHASVNIYQFTCAPRSITGLAMSALTIHAPHCTALRWMMNLGANSILNTWTVVGSIIAGEMCHDFITKSTAQSNNHNKSELHVQKDHH